MANDDELELDTKSAPKSGKGKLIIIIVAVMLVTTGVLVGVLFMTGALGGKSSGDSKDDSDTAAGDDKELVVKKSFYFDMKPAFIVNFEDQSQAAYLQIEMQAMTYDQSVTDEMIKHMPVIRNNILLILSAQKFEEVRTRQGKEALQEKVLIAVQEIIGDSMTAKLKESGEELPKGESVSNVEQIYFTSFIMQ